MSDSASFPLPERRRRHKPGGAEYGFARTLVQPMARPPFTKASQSELLRQGRADVQAALERLRRGEPIAGERPTQAEKDAALILGEELRDDDSDPKHVA